MTATALSAAAFGEDPGMWPLPAAHTPAELWLRAVAAGGQGHYGSAQADLSALLRQLPAGGLASLALSTRASFLRQLGGHRAARGWDGRALALAGTDGASTVEPAVDALVGLAADALGVGRLAASATLLERADAELARVDVPPARLAIRRAWVGAELAMAAGDGGRAGRPAGGGGPRRGGLLPGAGRHRGGGGPAGGLVRPLVHPPLGVLGLGAVVAVEPDDFEPDQHPHVERVVPAADPPEHLAVLGQHVGSRGVAVVAHDRLLW